MRKLWAEHDVPRYHLKVKAQTWAVEQKCKESIFDQSLGLFDQSIFSFLFPFFFTYTALCFSLAHPLSPCWF